MKSSEVWSKEQIFIDGDEYFKSLLNGIGSAKESILFETYIFEKSHIGDRIFSEFVNAAKRGVKIQILIDGYGSPNFADHYEEELSNMNIQVAFYRTLPWDPKTRSDENPNFLRRIRNRIYRLNHGTHRKYSLIDGKYLWAGSLNVSDSHSTQYSGEESWRDLGILVEGPEVVWAERAFRESFERRRHLKKHLKKREGKGSELVLLNQSRALKKIYRSGQIERLKSAKSRIWIETPYFAPLSRVFLNLIKLSKQGVDVRIIVPKRNDVWLAKWISYTYLYQLAKNGVQIFEYQPRFLHNKLFVIDDWICLGSTNLNHRSFLHDLEMDIVVTDSTNRALLLKTVSEDIQQSLPLNKDLWRVFPWWKRLLSRFLSIFAYWA